MKALSKKKSLYGYVSHNIKKNINFKSDIKVDFHKKVMLNST